MENIVTVVFKRESEAFQALAEFKKDMVNYGYKIVQLGIVKKENGVDTPIEGFDTKEKRRNIKDNTRLMQLAVSKTPDNATVLVALVEEHEDIVFNSRLSKFKPKPVITRHEKSALEKELDALEKAKKDAAKIAKKREDSSNLS